jgi:hypothetical protein
MPLATRRRAQDKQWDADRRGCVADEPWGPPDFQGVIIAWPKI